MVAQRNPYEFPAVRAFATELTAWRDEAGLSKTEFAEALGYTPQLIGQLESAKNIPSKKFSEDVDTFFKTNGLYLRLWKLITETRHLSPPPVGRSGCAEQEGRADVIRIFEALIIPVLLQTEEYARSLLMTTQAAGMAEESVSELMKRQAVFSCENPPLLWVTLDEHALRCPVGGPEVMRGQLQHLVEASDRHGVTIQVVPRTVSAYAGLEGSFTLLAMASGPGIVYTEVAGRGQIIHDAEGVRDFHIRYDLIRSYALPASESRRLIESILKDL